MTSILTNAAAMASLQALTATQRDLARTQAQVSSGLAVANASDNAAYWSISQTMSAQVAGLHAVNQGLALTMSVADVTAAALSSIKARSTGSWPTSFPPARRASINRPCRPTYRPSSNPSSRSRLRQLHGVNWLTNRILSSTVTTTTLTVDVSQTEYKAILLGQRPAGTTSVFDSTVATETQTSFDGTVSTSSNSYGYHVTTTDAGDGTEQTISTAKVPTSSGSQDLYARTHVTVPTGYTATAGLVTTAFPLAPLTLFSDFTGQYRSIQTVSFASKNDPSLSYDFPSSTPTTHSYDGYGGGATPGILDTVVVISDGPPAASGGGGGQDLREARRTC